EPDNDGSTPSFHEPWHFEGRELVWLDTPGRLAKSDNDYDDLWTIDLAVPCFGGFCAQDWEDFVHTVSGSSTLDASLYTQPIQNEHKIFGCDLWVEVSEVSERPETPITPQCSDGNDNDGDTNIDQNDEGCLDASGSYDPNDNDESDEIVP
ncbi:MAG: hypothetical protein G01um101470_913, partial [Parcubacteria group bacterium Gr01-1014_70]